MTDEGTRTIDRRGFLRASGAAATATALAGCVGGDDGTVTIGALQPLSGPFTAWGQAHRAGLAFAVEELNADGGIPGSEVEITEAGTGSDPSEADTLFRRFAESEGAPAYYADGEWRLSETFRSSPIPGFDPEEYDLE